MFICEECLKNYTNFAIPISRGPCEDCGKVGNCADIPLSALVYKEKQLNMFDVHERENNDESQEHLDKKRKVFSVKCEQVYNRLMNGEELTVLQCANEGIASLPRRIKDVRDKGFKISDRWKNDIKVYFMSEENKKYNQERENENSNLYTFR